MMLLGYDDYGKTIQFANTSWGRAWGDQGTGTLSYAYFKRRSRRDLGPISRPHRLTKVGPGADRDVRQKRPHQIKVFMR